MLNNLILSKKHYFLQIIKETLTCLIIRNHQCWWKSQNYELKC